MIPELLILTFQTSDFIYTFYEDLNTYLTDHWGYTPYGAGTTQKLVFTSSVLITYHNYLKRLLLRSKNISNVVIYSGRRYSYYSDTLEYFRSAIFDPKDRSDQLLIPYYKWY